MSEPPITLLAGSYGHTANVPITRVVIHDEEYETGPASAEAVATYFHRLPANGYASAHYVVDQNSEQHCVPENQIAYAAPPNPGIHIEQDGYAHYTVAEWRTPGAWATIARAAARTAELCVSYRLPVVWLSPEDLVAGHQGITSHLNVSQAFHQSDHTDPGLQYPVDSFLALVRQGVAALSDVRAFQREHGLVVDGDTGIKTVMTLGDVLIAGPVTPPPSPPRPVNRFAGFPTIKLGAHDPYLVNTNTAKAPVQAMQNALNIVLGMEARDNPNRLNPDGVFGAATNHVLRTWQSRNYISVDGVAGAQSWALLDYELDAKGR